MRTFGILASCLAIGGLGCVGSGDVPTRVSGQIVGEDERPLGPGLVLMEKGPVHDGAYEAGALIDDRGKFVTELGSGGTWGIHIFHDDYSYLPLEITIDDQQQVILTSVMVQWGMWLDLTGEPTWPDQPADQTLIRMPIDDLFDDNPVLERLDMAYDGEFLVITASVSDPNHDMSRMVLAYDETTGAGFALNPPSAPDIEGNYPNGEYTMKVFVDERHVPGESKWWFILSDNLCNNSPIKQVTMPPR